MRVETLEEPVLDHANLLVRFRHVGPVCILSMTGTLSVETVPALQSHVDRLGRTPCHRVVLDVADLHAIDDAGARVLTGIHHYVQARGGHMSVAGAAPGIAAVLASTPLPTG